MALLCRNLRFLRLSNEIVNISVRNSNTLQNWTLERQRAALTNEHRVVETKQDLPPASENFIEIHKEFLPNPDLKKRDRITELLERQDMIRRRSVIHIPAFYVGTIMAATIVDEHSPDKQSRFLGICIHREGHGLRANFTLRNVIDGQGLEVTYDLYCPLLLKIDVLRLEKRLDNELFYLRDAPLEYSTFPFDMVAIQHPPNEPVPVNPLMVKLHPRPWHRRWERANLKGVHELVISEKMRIKANHPDVLQPWNKYDLMKQYRNRINDVQTQEIMSDVFDQVSKTSKTKHMLKVNGKTSK